MPVEVCERVVEMIVVEYGWVCEVVPSLLSVIANFGHCTDAPMHRSVRSVFAWSCSTEVVLLAVVVAAVFQIVFCTCRCSEVVGVSHEVEVSWVVVGLLVLVLL